MKIQLIFKHFNNQETNSSYLVPGTVTSDNGNEYGAPIHSGALSLTSVTRILTGMTKLYEYQRKRKRKKKLVSFTSFPIINQRAFSCIVRHNIKSIIILHANEGEALTERL